MTTKVELETDGNFWKVLVAEGDKVAEGDTLFIMEVMKMEVPYEAPCDGVVTTLNVAEGDLGKEGDIVLEIG